MKFMSDEISSLGKHQEATLVGIEMQFNFYVKFLLNRIIYNERIASLICK